MALWRDPLEELIADLERTVPVEAGPVAFDMPPLEDLQAAVACALSRSPDERAHLEKDPAVQRVWAYYDRLASGSASEAAKGHTAQGVRGGGK
jgi:hypothetical protein